jgi:hypothetical protein
VTRAARAIERRLREQVDLAEWATDAARRLAVGASLDERLIAALAEELHEAAADTRTRAPATLPSSTAHTDVLCELADRLAVTVTVDREYVPGEGTQTIDVGSAS